MALSTRGTGQQVGYSPQMDVTAEERSLLGKDKVLLLHITITNPGVSTHFVITERQTGKTPRRRS